MGPMDPSMGDDVLAQLWSSKALYNRRSGECLDHAIHNGGHGVVWPCHFGRNQQFIRRGDTIRSRLTGKCLQPSQNTIHTRKKGAWVDFVHCNGSPAQRWEWTWIR